MFRLPYTRNRTCDMLTTSSLIPTQIPKQTDLLLEIQNSFSETERKRIWALLCVSVVLVDYLSRSPPAAAGTWSSSASLDVKINVYKAEAVGLSVGIPRKSFHSQSFERFRLGKVSE